MAHPIFSILQRMTDITYAAAWGPARGARPGCAPVIVNTGESRWFELLISFHNDTDYWIKRTDARAIVHRKHDFEICGVRSISDVRPRASD